MMCKRAHITVLATVNFIRVSLTEFCFILFRMIEILNAVVAHVAIIPVITTTSLDKLGTKLGDVIYWRSSSISYLSFVIVETFFRVMAILIPTRLCLESHQI